MECGDVVSFLENKRFMVLFSGGKDSLAALLWVLDNVSHEKWRILYVEILGNTHTMCTNYVKDVCELLGVRHKLIIDGRYDKNFMEYLKNYGVPLIRKYRWCLREFKIKVWQKYRNYSLIQVTGIKKHDSGTREKFSSIYYMEKSGFITVNPLFNWSTRQVLEYIRRHNVPINPCYRRYGHSGNCMFCPLFNKKQIILTLRDPEWGPKIIESLGHARGKTAKKIRDRWLKLYRSAHSIKTIDKWILF